MASVPKEILRLAFSLAVCVVTAVACAPQENGSKSYRVPYMDPATGGESYRTIDLKTLYTSNSLDGSVFHITVNGALTNGGLRGTNRVRLTRGGNTWKPMDVASEQALALAGQLEDIFFREQAWGVTDLLKYPRSVGVDFRISERTVNKEEYYNNAMFVVSMGAVVHYHSDRDAHTSTAMDACVNAHEHLHDIFQEHFVEPWKKELLRLQPTLDLREESLVDAFMKYDQLGGLGYIYGLISSWNEGLADIWCYAHTGQTRIGAYTMPLLTNNRELTTLNSNSLILNTAQETYLDLSRKRHGCKSRTCEKYFQGTNLARVLYKIAVQENGPREKFPVMIVRRLPAMAKAMAREMSALIERDNSLSALKEMNHGHFLRHIFDEDSFVSQGTCNVVQQALGAETHRKYMFERCRNEK